MNDVVSRKLFSRRASGLWWSMAVLPLFLLFGAERPSNNAGSPVGPNGGEALTPRGEQVAHGEYLVRHVAMCVVCHTPKTEQGTLLEQKLLQGGRIPVPSPYRGQQWAFQAPKLAGLPGGWTEESLATFLQTGKTPTGAVVRPPMPPFRMNEEDAHAVAAYLKSLPAD